MIRCPASCRSDIAGSVTAGCRRPTGTGAGLWTGVTRRAAASLAASRPAAWRAVAPNAADPGGLVIPLACSPPGARAPACPVPLREAGRFWVPGRDGREPPATVLAEQPASSATAATAQGIRTQERVRRTDTVLP